MVHPVGKPASAAPRRPAVDFAICPHCGRIFATVPGGVCPHCGYPFINVLERETAPPRRIRPALPPQTPPTKPELPRFPT